MAEKTRPASPARIIDEKWQTKIEDTRLSMNYPNGHVICIIGMHRSGTSMIAKLLHRCGLYLGPEDQLLGANSGNQEGHYEHKGFLKTNDALLHHFGGSWEFPPRFEAHWEETIALDAVRVEARALVAGLADRSPWGWKEPRTTVLLPFWKSIVPDIRFVICVRSPLEVAKSMAKRNKIPIERGIILWHRYMRAAIEETVGCPRIFTHYEDFFVEPAAEADRLIQFCGLHKPDDLTLRETEIRPELRHYKSEMSEILSVDSIPAEYKLLYLGLRGLSRDQIVAAPGRGESAENISELLRLLDEYHSREPIAQLQTDLAEARFEISKLRAEMLADLKANHRWTYRMYRNFIKPFRLG